MITLNTTAELADFCGRAAATNYVAVDTEFLRERTYYPQLCLVQLAYRGDGRNDAVLVDPLADGMELCPLFDLLRDRGTVKVLHSARQDIEIFWLDGNTIPAPLFDTQLAAMACGYGDQASYEILVRRITGQTIDKSKRMSDWSARPLGTAQARYALTDVTCLRDIYEALSHQLASNGRMHWLDEEHALLADPSTYRVDPRAVWARVKTRNRSARHLAIVRELACFRELWARQHNIPRNHVFRDDALLELATLKPRHVNELVPSRSLPRGLRSNGLASGILQAIDTALALPEGQLPRMARSGNPPAVNPACAELLRVLLRARCEREGVATRLVATAADIDAIAAGARDLPALSGWRHTIFGIDALRLCAGEIALSVEGESVATVEISR